MANLEELFELSLSAPLKEKEEGRWGPRMPIFLTKTDYTTKPFRLDQIFLSRYLSKMSVPLSYFILADINFCLFRKNQDL